MPGSRFACGVECVSSKSVRYVGARRTLTNTLKRTFGGGGGVFFVKGLRSLARTRKLIRLLLRRKATIAAGLNMLWQ